jgi:hypothetical protein
MLETHGTAAAVRSYEGLYRSQANDLFQADAVEAARHGWYPTAEQWLGGSLVVTYERGKRPRPSDDPDAPGPGRSRPSLMRMTAWVVALLVVIPVLSFVGVALVNLSQHGSIIAP